MFAGASWALININSYPFVVSMTNNADIGRYTGYYYFFSSLAAIVSPPLAGLLLDWIGFQVLFIYSVAGFAIALIFMLLVKPPEYYIIGNRLSEENAQKPEDVGNPMY
jgi:MFS family permease